jgi:EamA domain-containing membrane protein RarD
LATRSFHGFGKKHPPLEILAHRILWSVPFLFGWLAARGRLGELRAALRARRTVAILLVTTVSLRCRGPFIAQN